MGDRLRCNLSHVSKCGSICEHQRKRATGSHLGRRPENIGHGITIEDCSCRAVCKCCLEGKLVRLPFAKRSIRKSNQVLDHIHTDVCGPMQTPKPGGYRYFLKLTDDFSRYCAVYFLQNKSEVSDRIKEYTKYVKTLFDRAPKVIRSDQGGEFQNDALDKFCKEE